MVNAVSYLSGRDDVDAERIGAFGSGGTGGGNAVLLGAADARVGAVVSQVPVADGADWLHRMRSEDQWLAFLAAVDADRRERARSGRGRLVDPRRDIVVPSAERRATSVKADVDQRVPSEVWLTAADELLAYRPLDAAGRLEVPLLVIAVEGDSTTPTDHAVQLYEAARGPRALILQRHTSHYAAYERYGSVVAPRIVDWFDRHLRSAAVEMRSHDGQRGSIEWIEEA
jgi:pimeloyl-ACP methyl ester carboxylesterase